MFLCEFRLIHALFDVETVALCCCYFCCYICIYVLLLLFEAIAWLKQCILGYCIVKSINFMKIIAHSQILTAPSFTSSWCWACLMDIWEGKAGKLWLYLREETLFLLGRQKEADHSEELQVSGGHRDPPQATVHQVYGQVQSLILEMQHLLRGIQYTIKYSNHMHYSS